MLFCLFETKGARRFEQRKTMFFFYILDVIYVCIIRETTTVYRINPELKMKTRNLKDVHIGHDIPQVLNEG